MSQRYDSRRYDIQCYDIEVALPDRAGALAQFGETLGAAGVSLEGGGVFTVGGTGVAHFLVEDAAGARAALEAVGLAPVTVSPVVTLRLDQGTPGQLGLVGRRMADAGINIQTQYSDHHNNLVLVVPDDQHEHAAAVATAWAAARR